MGSVGALHTALTRISHVRDNMLWVKVTNRNVHFEPADRRYLVALEYSSLHQFHRVLLRIGSYTHTCESPRYVLVYRLFQLYPIAANHHFILANIPGGETLQDRYPPESRPPKKVGSPYTNKRPTEQNMSHLGQAAGRGAS